METLNAASDQAHGCAPIGNSGMGAAYFSVARLGKTAVQHLTVNFRNAGPLLVPGLFLLLTASSFQSKRYQS